jgi:membrane protein
VLREIYPSATAQESRLARELVNGRALSLGIGAVGTVVSALGFYRALETAFAIVLGRTGRRAFVRDNLEAIAFVCALLLLAATSFALSYAATALTEGLSAAGLDAVGRAFLRIASPLAGVVVGFLFFFLVYRFVPRPRVPTVFAGAAALVSAVLWEVAKLAFGFFTRALGTFAAYGPLAFAAGLLTWIYLTAVIILIGAEVIKTRGAA